MDRGAYQTTVHGVAERLTRLSDYHSAAAAAAKSLQSCPTLCEYTHTYICACIYICVCVCVYMHIYTYKHIPIYALKVSLTLIYKMLFHNVHLN